MRTRYAIPAIAVAFLAGSATVALAQTATPGQQDARDALTVVSEFIEAHPDATTTTTVAPTTTSSSTTTTVAPTTTTIAPTTTTVPATTTTLPAAGDVGEQYGGYATPIGAYQSVAYNTNDAQKVKQAGFGWVRVDATVKAVMPTATTRNYQSMWNWVDPFVAAGIKPMVNWYILPQWMNGSTNDKTQPLTDKVYADSLTEAAPLMWAHGVRAIELWNEPNLSGFWAPTPDRVRYVSMAKSAAAAIRVAAPGMLIVTGGISTADTEYGNGTHKTVTRYDTGASYTTTEIGANQTLDIYGALGLCAAKDAAGRLLFDGVGIHPYLDGTDPSTGGTVDGWMRWQENSMRRSIGILDKWGCQGVKVWNTESAAPRSVMSEQEQANRAAHAFQAFNLWTLANLAKMRTRLGPYFYFTYADWTSASEARARTFGLVTPTYVDHLARPAVSAVLDDPVA